MSKILSQIEHTAVKKYRIKQSRLYLFQLFFFSSSLLFNFFTQNFVLMINKKKAMQHIFGCFFFAIGIYLANLMT